MHIRIVPNFLRLIAGILCVHRDGTVSPYIKTFIIFEMILKTDVYLLQHLAVFDVTLHVDIWLCWGLRNAKIMATGTSLCKNEPYRLSCVIDVFYAPWIEAFQPPYHGGKSCRYPLDRSLVQ